MDETDVGCGPGSPDAKLLSSMATPCKNSPDGLSTYATPRHFPSDKYGTEAAMVPIRFRVMHFRLSSGHRLAIGQRSLAIGLLPRGGCLFRGRKVSAEPPAETNRGRHPGFPSYNVTAGGPGSLAERSSANREGQMKTAVIGLLLVLATCVLIGCNRGSPIPAVKVIDKTAQDSLEPLKAYRGKELAKLDEAQVEELLATIRKLLPGRKYEDWFDFRPWYVWEFPNNGNPALLLFEVNNTGPHPGSTVIRITVFENSGKVTAQSEFRTGHRCYIRAASLEEQADDQDPLIALETGPGAGPGPDVQRQIYAPFGSRFDLVRIENADGRATRNNYYVNHFACGPEIPKQTPAAWESDVLSGDRLRELRALVWLGGAHWEGQPPDKSEKQHEPVEQIELVRNVRANQRVVDKLKALAKSEDRWVREAAALAADPKDNRW